MRSLARDIVPSNAVNDRDHGPLVTVAVAFCTTLSLLLLGGRLLTRWPWRSLFGRDDAATAAATLLAIAQAIVILRAVSHGLGRMPEDLSQSAALVAAKLLYASDVLFVVTVFLSKLAVALFLHRLSSSPTHRQYTNIIVAASPVFCVVSVLLVAIRQQPSVPWLDTREVASSTLARWIAFAVMSNILDLLIFAFAVYLVSGLQMQFATKLKVVVGFALRLPLIPVSIIRVVSLSRTLRSDVFLFDYVTPEIYTQAELCYAVLSATIPCLRIFLAAAQTGLLDLEATNTRTGDHNTGSCPQPLSASTARRNWKGLDAIELTAREHGETVSKVMTAGEDNRSMTSDSSEMAIVIRQTVDVRYEI